ncbi:spindle and kinetochore-associated protein 3 [Erythrolamprus reginae]|uniref:spindle and kinetochore-associated protein 3 n=1 Tax=Erythrolamprus reginae TaxID=121349 RepID=UPI00396CFD03
MDVTGTFFNKLRTLAVTLEKQAEQFKQILQEDDEEFEDDSPMRYLHELYSEARTLKADADNILHTSSSERNATYDFIKASKVLRKRNETNLEKLRDFFQKYGYKPLIDKNEAIKVGDEINAGSALSDQEEAKPLDFPQKSSGSPSILETPQLSDFGLSKYALPSSLNTVRIPHSQNEEVKADKFEYLSPKVECFNICGRDLSVNDETTNLMDDQTIFLLNKGRKNRSAKAMVSNQNLAALRQPNEASDDCFASPDTPEFCTPGVKIARRKTAVLSESPESNHSDVSKRTTEISPLERKPQRIQPMRVNAAKTLPDNDLIEDSDQPVLDSDKYLECTVEPPPPVTSVHEDLFSAPLAPPEITVIPDNLLQILSRYNPKLPKAAAKGTEEKNVSQFVEKRFLRSDNKENRKYSGRNED